MIKTKIYIFYFLGQFLTQRILENQTDLELAFVWNRSKEVLNSSNIPKELILENLEDCATRHPDLIVEVAHPIIVEKVNITNLIIIIIIINVMI